MRRKEQNAAGEQNGSGVPGRSGTVLMCVLLAVLAVWTFQPVMRNDFINYDDPDYITRNAHVQAGITRESLRWAITTFHACNWHPVTWLSHQLDCQWFGLNASGHHGVGLAFHTANAVLLFLVLRRMTCTFWRSAVVAAWFALHPMHVESVAWASERKDLLSGFFALLTLWAYSRYAEFKIQNSDESRARAERCSQFKMEKGVWYGTALAFFALGLMSKPMLVTLPVILLLLDFWPLARFQTLAAGSSQSSHHDSDRKTGCLRRLIWEKWPFFAVAVAAAILTFMAQRGAGAVESPERLPLERRVDNALVSYVTYLQKWVWPTNLSVYYPYHEVEAWQATGAGLLLIGLSILAIRSARARPYLLVGWFWFVVMLLPVIGLIQTGSQSMADRYTYLPYIGLFLVAAWVAVEMMPRTVPWRTILSLGAAASLVLCCSITRSQVRFWKDSVTLFRHALDVTPLNPWALDNLGCALLAAGNRQQAALCFQAALELQPNYARSHLNLGSLLLQEQAYEPAEVHLRKAIAFSPDYAAAHHALGNLLVYRGRYPEAESHYRAALQLRPDLVDVRCSLGGALALQQKNEEARTVLVEGLQQAPRDPNLHRNLGNVLLASGNLPGGVAEYFTAVELAPNDATLHEGLARLLVKQGRTDIALIQLQEGLKLKPTAELHAAAAAILEAEGNLPGAVQHYREALRLKSDSPVVLNNLAWLLATSADDKIRDGPQAVQLAEKACEWAAYKRPLFVGTLAAAYAESGRFEEAVATAEKACALASESGNTNLLQRNRQLLELYQSSRPCRESVQTNLFKQPSDRSGSE